MALYAIHIHCAAPSNEPFATIQESSTAEQEHESESESDAGYGVYPDSVVTPLLARTFPYIGKNQVSSNNASVRERKHPSYNITSTKQMTNNLRYFRSPDVGTAMRPEFTDAMYKPVRNKTNVVHPLGPVEPGPGVRVGYYRTKI